MKTKQLLVFGEKTFKVTVPINAKITFGPWSPPTKGFNGDRETLKGTLRIYEKTKDNIVAVFTGVQGFRDLSLQYAEQIAKEEGAVIWKDDKDGYQREEKVARKQEWIVNPENQLAAPTKANKKGKKSKGDQEAEIPF